MFQQSLDIENHVIHTIDRDLLLDYTPLRLKGAKTEQVFYYSSQWNFYYTCEQLAKLLPDEDAVIVAHDWLELGMVSNLGLQNPVVQVLHGDFDYYYKLAMLHADNIDVHICVSSVIARKIERHLKTAESVKYLRFPVPEVFNVNYKGIDEINCVFFVRNLTDERKQMNILPQVEKILLESNLQIKWHLAGGGMSKQDLVNNWGELFSERIIFWGELDRDGIDKMLRECNVMILPSLAEGFPVSVVESMKYGIVPLIPNWNGAVEELVLDNETGFYCDVKCPASFAQKIIFLSENVIILEQMSLAARNAAGSLFDPHLNAHAYENEFKNAAFNKKNKNKFKSYGSRLDQPWIPNLLVTAIRKQIKNR